MNAYLPSSQTTLLLLIIAMAGTLATSFAITRIRAVTRARTEAWLFALVSVAGIERLFKDEPAGFRMLAIILILFYAMKAIVTVEGQSSGEDRLKPICWFSFALGWFGMRQSIFASLGRAPVSKAKSLIRLGVTRLVTGIFLVLLSWLLWNGLQPRLNPTILIIVSTSLLLAGLSFILHFGILNLLAGFWRLLGVNCNQLFRAPLLSTSLSEFWGRRWNLAFSEMTAVGVYRPLIPKFGKRVAVVTAFLFSGLLHELAISVPVHNGYGLPFTYFLIHGLLVLLERKLEQMERPIYRIRWLGRIWTLFWLVFPLPILFHWHFLNGVIWPIIGIGV